MSLVELTSEVKVFFGVKLHRIKATKDLPNGVKKGELGGFIEKTTNLYGNAWVYGDAQVYGNAWVYGNAQVYGDAIVDSVSAIIVLCIALKYSVTVTRKLIFIGCKVFKRKEILSLTKKQAGELGLPAELYRPYKAMILGALEIVKEKE